MATLKFVVLICVFLAIIVDAAKEKRDLDKEIKQFACRRNKFLRQERNRGLGSALVLNSDEKKANETIMKLKFKELDEGFRTPTNFKPYKTFFGVAEDVNKTDLYKLLRAMPKGAVLHGHDVALVSVDYVLYNLTYRKNVQALICNHTLRELTFSETNLTINHTNGANVGCDWKNLTALRTTNGSTSIDAWLKPQLSLNKNDTGLDVNSVWQRFMQKFGIMTPLVTYEEAWKDYFYQTLKEFHEDNVTYIEFRGLLNDVYKKNRSELITGVNVAKLYVETLERFKREHPDFYDAKFIYAPLRFVNTTTFQPYITTLDALLKQYPDFIAGFDLVAQEDIGTTLLTLSSKIIELKNRTNFFFHAGETNWNGFHSDDNLIDALLLGTKRIGHGYAITKHPKVAQYVKEHRIGVELCPISNQVLGLVKDLRNHPMAAMFTDDYPIVLAPDDPGFWGARGVSFDWYEAFLGLSARWQDLRLLKQLALNSIEQSALNTTARKTLQDKWQSKWDQFIKDVNDGKIISKNNNKSKNKNKATKTKRLPK